MKGRLLDISYGVNRKQRLTVELDGDFRASFEALKDFLLDIDIKKHREKRSANANAYFHLLVGKIAEAQGRGFDEVKTRLVDGTISEAKELGIETDTPEQLEKFKSHWAQAERRTHNA